MADGGSKLSEEEIFQCLTSLNVPARMNDIKFPTREFIIRVFECFLKDLDIDIMSAEFRTWRAMRHMEDTDLFEDSQLLVLLQMIVNHIITTPSGINNITIKDIAEPKPKRTKKILNFLLVFWNYYLQKYARFHAMEASYADAKQESASLIQENEALDERYEEKLNVLNDIQASSNMQELSSILKATEEKAAKLNAESASIGSEYQALKTREVNIRNQMGTLDVQIITAKQTLEELSQQILSSPDRINAEIKKLQDTIKAEDLKIKEIEGRSKDTVKMLELLDEIFEKKEKTICIVKQTNEIYNDLRNKGKFIVDVNQKLIIEDDKLKKIEVDFDRIEGTKMQLKQTSAEVGLSSQKQVETLRDILKINKKAEAKQQKKIELMNSEIQDLQEGIDNESDRILELYENCKEADAKSKERQSQFRAKISQISSEFSSDCDEVVDMVKTAFQNKS